MTHLPLEKKRNVIIMAGGTGGHVFPALAVAEQLRHEGYAPIWFGTQRGLEARVVPQHDFPICYLPVRGLRGKQVLQRLGGMIRLLISILLASAYLLRYRPAFVLGMGGYVSGPGGIAARLTGVPLIIHEQNSVAGLTNRKLAKLAKRVLEAFPGSFGEGYQAIHTGNPLREGFIASEADRDEEAGRDNNVPANRPFHLLVVGGSQGAAILNQVVPDALGLYQGSRDLWVRHQCGRGQVEALGRNYQGVEGRIEVVEFIEEMAQAYRWADVVICRAGAMTIAELAASGKASVLIPLPSAVDDHQTGNARYLSDKDAAILLPQSELDAKKLASYLKELAEHPERLMKMGQKARDAALPEATQNVVKQCLEVLQ